MITRKLLLNAAIVGACGVACLAKTPTLSGKMVAYDPLLHAAKAASYESNKEVVILEVPGRKNKYVKVVFVGFGTTQIEQKYFDGTEPLSVQALRDHACDEVSPRLVTQVGLDQKSGTYLLTDPYKAQSPKIKSVECYDATAKKK